MADGTPLQRCRGLYLCNETAKGRAVFTAEAIQSGTIIDICPVLILTPEENDLHIKHTTMYHYTYNWPVTDAHGLPTGKHTQAIILGLGSMFNHSRQHQNVGWMRDLTNQVIVYRALRDINPHEELCISYGDHLTFTDVDSAVDSDEAVAESDVLGRIHLDCIESA